MKKLFILAFLLFASHSFEQTVRGWGTNTKAAPAYRIITGTGRDSVHVIPVGTSGQILKSNGSTGHPTWTNADSLGTITVPVSVANGGLATTTLTNHGVVIGQGTSAAHITAAGTAGQYLTSGGASSDPVWYTPTILTSLTADTATTGQTLVGTPLIFAVGVTQTWSFDVYLSTASSSSAGDEFGVSFPNSATVLVRTNGTTSGITAYSTDAITASATAGIAYNTVNATTGYVELHGTITTDGTHSGNVVIQFLKVTSGTATVKAGSYCVARRIN